MESREARPCSEASRPTSSWRRGEGRRCLGDSCRPGQHIQGFLQVLQQRWQDRRHQKQSGGRSKTDQEHWIDQRGRHRIAKRQLFPLEVGELPEDLMYRKETLSLLRYYYSIPDQSLRQRFVENHQFRRAHRVSTRC